MKRRNILRTGLALSLTAALTGMLITLLPEKPGIRIPVHCANGRMGYLDDTGRMVLPAKWDRATPFTPDGNGYVGSEGRRKWFEVNFSRIIPKFRRNVMLPGSDWKMDRLGNLSSYLRIQASQRDPRTLPTEPDSHGMIMMRDKGAFRWITKGGSEAFPGKWETAIHFKNDDPAAVFKNGRWGFINRKGEAITPLEWEKTHGFDGKGRACVSVDDKWGVINSRGEPVVPLYFNYLAGFDAKDMCAAQLESGCGFIDRAGRIVIPFRYLRADAFDRFEMAKVIMWDESENPRVGWIDRSGTLVIPCIYHDCLPDWNWRFDDHELLPVCNDKGFGLIDRKGRVVIPPGGGPIAHVEDPLAPGRFWLTRVPAEPHSNDRSGPFKPACYDQTGKLIWSGSSLTRSEIALRFTAVFGTLTLIMFVAWVRLKSPETLPEAKQ